MGSDYLFGIFKIFFEYMYRFKACIVGL